MPNLSDIISRCMIFLRLGDHAFTRKIEFYLGEFNTTNNPTFLTQNSLLFVKLCVYLIATIVPLLLLRAKYPDNEGFKFSTTLILILVVILLLLTFFAFISLFFNYS